MCSAQSMTARQYVLPNLWQRVEIDSCAQISMSVIARYSNTHVNVNSEIYRQQGLCWRHVNLCAKPLIHTSLECSLHNTLEGSQTCFGKTNHWERRLIIPQHSPTHTRTRTHTHTHMHTYTTRTRTHTTRTHAHTHTRAHARTHTPHMYISYMTLHNIWYMMAWG